MVQEHGPSRPQRVLIIRPSALGDVCRTVPVMSSLRAALPEAHIAWVVQDDFAPAIEAHPALDEVIAFPRNRFGKWWASPARAAEVRRWFADLRKREFDVAIDCQGLSRSGLITRATRAPLRIGLRTAREFAWLCYNRRVPEDAAAPLPAHTVDRMLALLAPLNVPAGHDMRLYAPPDDEQWWAGQRIALGIDKRQPYAVFAPGSRWLSKRWPIERFADIIEPLIKRGFSRVVVIGSASEREQVKPLLERVTSEESRNTNGSTATVPDSSLVTRHLSLVTDLVGSTTIGQTMAVIAGAGLVIANDSAPLHMAVGFDRPCVALYGPTDPVTVGPFRRAECVVRAYQPAAGEAINYKDPRLGDSLMRLISTALVLQSVDRVLALWPQREQWAAQSAMPPVARPGAASAVAIAIPRRLEPKAAS